jgi:hypothetical protein
MNTKTPISIIDIIEHKNKYSTQTFVVTDRNPVFVYERVGDLLIAEDSGFFSFFMYQRPFKNSEAFAGRKFVIPLVDGDDVSANGQWWDHFPQDYQDLVYKLGANSPAELGKCNVFTGSYIDIEIVDYWLKSNEPTNNYSKYDKRSNNYMVQTIETRW